MKNNLFGYLFQIQLIQNSLFMENNLLRSLFIKINIAYLKQLIYEEQLIRISFSKTTYLKQLIYAKQLIKISFLITTYSKQLTYDKTTY